MNRLPKAMRTSWDFDAVLEYVKRNWWASDWGFSRRGLRVSLHTGGWSDNEVFVRELENSFFWFCCWVKSERGGHYTFKLPKSYKAFMAAGGKHERTSAGHKKM